MRNIVIVFFLLSILAICGNKTYSQQDKIKAGIMQVYDDFSTGNVQDLGTYIDAGFIEHTPAPNQKDGLEGLKGLIGDLKTAFPDGKFIIKDIIISGSKASVLSEYTGTNTGTFMGMPATNKPVDFMNIDYLLFNSSGKCTEHWGYGDDFKMMSQLGLMK